MRSLTPKSVRPETVKTQNQQTLGRKTSGATLLLSAFLILCFAGVARAGTVRIWNGNISPFMATPGNWSNNIVPVAGDDLVFPANPARAGLPGTLLSHPFPLT